MPVKNYKNLNNKNTDISWIKEDSHESISLKKALAISTAAHPAFVLLCYVLIFILSFFGITFTLFNKPEPKTRDIEFVLVTKPEQQPLNKKTILRADMNSRAGGKHEKNKKVAEPVPGPVTPKPSRPQLSKKAVENKPEPPAPKAPQREKSHPQPKKTAPVNRPKPPSAEIPVPSELSRPAPVPRKISPPNGFKIPAPPRSQGPKSSSSGFSGPVTSAPKGDTMPSGSPSPSMGSSRGGSLASRRSGGYSMGGGGQAGNPSPGNPNGSPGVDAMKDADFGPYMRDLQRRIKRNWEPPKGNESRRVVLLFKVARDGRLLSIKVKNSSGVPVADKAAISAVELTAPFRPLPPEYKGRDIDIEFTFDYNVFGVGRAY